MSQGQAGTRTFGSYIALKQEGRWAYGTLHSGRDHATQIDVSIWLHRPPAERPELGEEFLRTAESLALVKHPLLPAVLDSGIDGTEYFAVTEAVRGTPLTGNEAHMRADDRTLVRWARDLALALQAIHSQGLVVRDLKPANFRIDGAGKMRWVGAGLSQFLNDPAPEYSSPEELRGESAEIGPVSDVYSLGATLYEWLVGTPPFLADSDKAIKQARSLNREAPPVRDTVRGFARPSRRSSPSR